MNGHEKNPPEEVKIPVPWGHISGKWWGPKDMQPVLAMHGWQDNAGSFDTLNEILAKNIAVLAIDIPGHGYSSHLPPGQFYYIMWEGVIWTRRIVKYYQWGKVKILGHSLGGAVGFLYAATYPDEVEYLISIDIVSPCVRSIEKTVSATHTDIDKFLNYEKMTLDSVPDYSYKQMVDIVESAYSGGITRKSAEILMKRGIQPSAEPGRFYFSRDSRLKTSFYGGVSLDVVLAYARRITCSYLNIRAKPGIQFEQPEIYGQVLDVIKKSAVRFQYREVPGTHHVHLNHPERVAPIITEFLDP